MTTATYQSTTPATMPPGLEVDTEDNNGAKRQVVIVRNPSAGTALTTSEAATTDGTQLTRIVDLHGHQVNVQSVTATMDGDEYGAVTCATLHGRTSQGVWKDVKVNPSGALTVESTIAGIDSGVALPVTDNNSSLTVDNAGTFAVQATNTVTTTRADDAYNDAFQRLRVSETGQRFDAEFIYDKLPNLFDEIVSGTGTATHDANARDVVLAVGGTANGAAAGLYQHFYNPYTAGNSQAVFVTGTLNSANAAGTASVFLRSNVTGTVTEEVIPQAQWVNATSGVNWNYSQIFVMDFQSLKVGRIRFGLDRGGILVPVAEITNDNERATGYWQLAHAPVFWRVYNTATATVTEFGYGDASNAIGFRYTTNAVNGSQTARAICCTVKSEGGDNLLDMTGSKFAAGNGATTKTVSTTLIPLASVQLKTTFGAGANRGIVLPQAVSFITDNPIYYEVRVNPTLTGASFASVDANSICNVDTSASAVSGGRVIAAGYAGSGGTRSAATGAALIGKAPLSVNYAGTTGDIITVCAIRVGTTNAAAGAVAEWKEVR